MTTRSQRGGQPDPPAHSPGLVFVGASLDSVLRATLKRAFATAKFVSDLEGYPLATADIAVGLFGADVCEALLAFAAGAHLAGASALCVVLRAKEVLIGPLAFPSRAGCGRCACERMTAAAANGQSVESVSGPRSSEVAHVAGRALVRELRAILRYRPKRSRLLDHILAVDVDSEDQALHRIIPLPDCSVCGGAVVFPRRSRTPVKLSPDDRPDIVLGALAGWVDGRTGIISGVFLEPSLEMPLGLPFIATAAPPHVRGEDGSLKALPLGWGKGLTVSGAVLSAVGEAIERYAASLPDRDRIILERAENVDGEYLDPRECALYADARYQTLGFPYVQFDPAVRHPWVLGKWLGGGAPVWVPAVFAFLSLTVTPEQLICQGTSNGLAASFDEDDASQRATLELIERDALMAAWRSGCPGQRLGMDEAVDPVLRRVLDGIETLGATVEVYSLPTSACGVTILCLALGDGERYPGATIGLGTSLDRLTALRQAVLELGQTGPHLRRMMRSRALRVPEEPGGVIQMTDHAAYYFPSERVAAFDRLRSDGAPVAWRDFAAQVPNQSPSAFALGANELRMALEAAGIRIALVDVTSADVATGPFRVVRAVSPDLQPISYGYGLDREPVNRLRMRGLASDAPPIHPIW